MFITIRMKGERFNKKVDIFCTKEKIFLLN